MSQTPPLLIIYPYVRFKAFISRSSRHCALRKFSQLWLPNTIREFASVSADLCFSLLVCKSHLCTVHDWCSCTTCWQAVHHTTADCCAPPAHPEPAPSCSACQVAPRASGLPLVDLLPTDLAESPTSRTTCRVPGHTWTS